MMRNNRIFQSLGIPAIVGMLRRSNGQKEANGWEEGSIITSDESASAITQGRSSDYDPREDEVVDEEEVDDTVVEKNVKVQDCACVLCLFLFHSVHIISNL
jgi:hypothetical protein